MPNTPPPDTTQPPPEDLNARIDRYLAQLTPPQRSYAPPAPVDRSTASLLGEALGGGTTGLAPADRESAGTRALLNFGLNMLSASGPSVMPRGFGQIFAQGAGGAQQSLGGSEAVGAARTAAQQAYEEKQQELTISRIKEAIPLLTLQTQMQQAAAARGLAGNQAAPAPGTSISAAGVPSGPRASIGAAGGPDEFAQKFTPLAQTIAEQTGLPAEYVLAQAAHETGFGKSPAAANNNFFGITDPKTGKLASYATPQEGAAAYVQLMQTDRYANVARTGTPAEIGDRMALAGYNPNVPAKDKTDSYGARIGGVASMLARPKPGPTGAPPAASGAPGAPAPAPTATAPAAATLAPVKVAGPGAPTAAAPAPEELPLADAMAKAKATGQPVLIQGGNGAAIKPDGTINMPAATAPPVPQYPDVVSGGVTVRHPGSFADFSVRERLPTPNTENFNPDLTPKQEAAFAAKAKDLALKRQQIGTLAYADQPKAAAELTAQVAALEADRQNAAQAKAQAAAAARTVFDVEQNKAVQTRYDEAVKNYNGAVTAQGTLENTLKIEAAKGSEARQTAAASSENQYVLDERKRFGTERDAARENIDSLQMLKALSDAAGKNPATPLETVQIGDKTGRDFMLQLGLGTDAMRQKWGAQQAFEAAANKTITDLRKGVSMGQLSDRDMVFLTHMAPTLMQNSQTRADVISYLEQAQYRKLQYTDAVEQLWDGGKGMSWGKAKVEAQKGMPDYVPSVPKEYDGWNAATRQQWLQDQITAKKIRPGQLIRGAGGRLSRVPAPDDPP